MTNSYVLQANAKVGNHLINITGIDQYTFQQNLQWVTTNAAGIVSALAALEAAYAVKPLAGNVQSTQVVNEPQQAPQEPPWQHRPADPAPVQQYQQPQQQQPQYQQPQGRPAPSCAHGPMKLVPAGTSKNTGKAYNAFYSCTGPRESQCKSQDS